MGKFRATLSFLAVLMTSTGQCENLTCNAVPPNDVVNPRATLTIDYAIGIGGETKHEVIKNDRTVTIPSGNKFQIIYGGEDNVGIKTVTLAWTKLVGTTSQQSLVIPHDFGTVACSPRTWTEEFSAVGSGIYTFSASTTDFHGNGARSPDLKVIYGTPGPLDPNPAQFSAQSFDFRPQDGAYTVNWPGPPRRPMTFSDVERFDLDVRANPVSHSLTLTFEVRKNRSWHKDPLIGYVLVSVQRNEQPTIDYLSTYPGANVPRPEGSPNIIGDSFWLGCTQDRKLRGNYGKEDDGGGNIFLQLTKVAYTGTGYKYPNVKGYGMKSPEHAIRCR